MTLIVRMIRICLMLHFIETMLLPPGLIKFGFPTLSIPWTFVLIESGNCPLLTLAHPHGFSWIILLLPHISLKAFSLVTFLYIVLNKNKLGVPFSMLNIPHLNNGQIILMPL